MGNMGWQHVLRHVNTQRPSDFNAGFAETNSAFFNEFIIVEVFSPGDGLDMIDGGEDGATVNYSWGPDSHGNEIYSNL